MIGKFFQLEQRRTNFRTELIAGLTTFLTMAYIIFVNSNILAEAGMDKSALILVTCLVTAFSTFTTGLVANAPIAMAPGMGINAFFTYSLVKSEGVAWETALGAVFLSGLFFLILTVVGLRKRLVDAIPHSLISAIAVGIGLFITFIGLQKMGLVIGDPVTLVKGAPLTRTALIGLGGLLVMVILEIRKFPGSLLIGILFATLVAGIAGDVAIPPRIMSMRMNIAPVALQLDIPGAMKWGMIGSIFTLMFMDMFDSIGTLLAITPRAGMRRSDGSIEKIDTLLSIDAMATMFGALCGTSTTTTYLESAAGIEQGGRTGLTSIITAACFLLAALFVPLVNVVPPYATAPALIMVGLFMIKQIHEIDFEDIEKGMPAFIIMVMIALSYSISTGLAFGFLAHTIIQILRGRIFSIPLTMWIIAALSVLYFIPVK
jgi:AGZA family xanthine/uracil permease-like MFS transporter